MLSLAPDAPVPQHFLSETPFLEGARKAERAGIAKALSVHISPQGLRTAGIFSQTLKAVCGVSWQHWEGYLQGGWTGTGTVGLSRTL